MMMRVIKVSEEVLGYKKNPQTFKPYIRQNVDTKVNGKTFKGLNVLSLWVPTNVSNNSVEGWRTDILYGKDWAPLVEENKKGEKVPVIRSHMIKYICK